MIFDALGDLNWLAVIVAGLAYFAIGAIWYSNGLMGKQYRAAIGQDPNAPAKMEPAALVTNLIGWIVAAAALGLVSLSIGADSVGDGLALGLLVWLGFIATNRVVAAMYEGPNRALMMVNGPYNLIGYLAMGVILAVWT